MAVELGRDNHETLMTCAGRWTCAPMAHLDLLIEVITKVFGQTIAALVAAAGPAATCVASFTPGAHAHAATGQACPEAAGWPGTAPRPQL